MPKTLNRKSNRLKGYDYSQTGYYYVTICTYNRVDYFGEIINNQMVLSKIGEIGRQYWQEIPRHYPNVELNEYVIMPNHIHGIVVINGNVGTQNFASLQNRGIYPLSKPGNEFGPQSKNLSSIIRGYKAGVKKWATINDVDFKWQSRFHDHVIRNLESLAKIRQYIAINPVIWDDDENNIKDKKL